MYSFDIYDTLVTRTVCEPCGIFMIMQEKMQRLSAWEKTYVAENFTQLRIAAEEQARCQKIGEVELQDIYDMLSHNCGLPEDAVRELMELEITTEIDNSVAIEENAAKVDSLLKQGEKIILISDMYLSSEVIRRVLRKAIPQVEKLPLYVSCEIGKTKRSGLLYEYVQQQEREEFGNWTHIGDNQVSDQNIPQLFGIRVIPYVPAKETEWERVMLKLNPYDPLLQLVTGLAKIAGEKCSKTEYRIGYSCFGVMLFPYVQWILEMAVKLKLRKLYFVARDGYVLKKIADKIIEKEGLMIQTAYLYGSRKVWSTNGTNLLEAYLKQEMDVTYREAALVDTQGTGRSIAYLASVANQTINVFYYAFPKRRGDKNINPYVYRKYSGGDFIEVLCRAPHGSTIDYQEIDGRIEPVLAEMSEEIWEKSGLSECYRGVYDFVEDIQTFCKINGVGSRLYSYAEKLMHYCVDTPDKLLADFVGNIPHDVNNENEITLYAPLLSRDNIYNIEVVRKQESVDVFYSGANLAYSYKRLAKAEQDYQQECCREYAEQARRVPKLLAKRVVLYGNGIYGKELWHQLAFIPEVEVISIVDSNHQRFRNGNVEVAPVSRLLTDDYDYIVITLLDVDVIEEIRKMLVAAGIDEKKILDRNTFLDLINL